MRSRRIAARVAGLVAMLLFLGALAAPFAQIIDRGRASGPVIEPGTGYVLAAFGWLGPLAFSVAWFANVFLAVSLVRLLRGRLPGVRSAAWGLGIAASALLPMRVYTFEDGAHWEILRGLAIFLWIASFVVIGAAAVAPRLSNRRSVHDA